MWPLLFFLLAEFLPGAQHAVWGGDHIELQVIADGVRVEFDCAHGTIDERLPRDGTFSLKGTFTPEARGPARDEGPAAVKATYSGAIKGDEMTLRVAVQGVDAPPQEYALKRDRPGNVRKCR